VNEIARRQGAPSRLELAGLLGILAIAGLVLGRGIGAPSAEFDEAVYLASARALAGGAELGREVFASQPPLFFTALEGAHRLVGGDASLIRAFMLVGALGGAVCVSVRGPRSRTPAAGQTSSNGQTQAIRSSQALMEISACRVDGGDRRS